MSFSIDHAVIFVEDLPKATRDFTKLGFQVLEGGTHAGGLTHNALIVFADGSYLELLAFSFPSAFDALADLAGNGFLPWVLKGRTALDRRFLPLGARGEGLHDFALSTVNIESVTTLANDSGLRLAGPYTGKRVRTDGVTLAWALAIPTDPVLPFLIEDVTDRALRVPTGDAATHANGVAGIANVIVPVDHLESAVNRYGLLLRQEPQRTSKTAEFTFPRGKITLTIRATADDRPSLELGSHEQRARKTLAKSRCHGAKIVLVGGVQQGGRSRSKTSDGKPRDVVIGRAPLGQVRENFTHHAGKLVAVPGKSRRYGDLGMFGMCVHHEVFVFGVGEHARLHVGKRAVGGREVACDEVSQDPLVLLVRLPIHAVGIDHLFQMMVAAQLETGHTKHRESIEVTLVRSEVEHREAVEVKQFWLQRLEPAQRLTFRDRIPDEFFDEIRGPRAGGKDKSFRLVIAAIGGDGHDTVRTYLPRDHLFIGPHLGVGSCGSSNVRHDGPLGKNEPALGLPDRLEPVRQLVTGKACDDLIRGEDLVFEPVGLAGGDRPVEHLRSGPAHVQRAGDVQQLLLELGFD